MLQFFHVMSILFLTRNLLNTAYLLVRREKLLFSQEKLRLKIAKFFYYLCSDSNVNIS